MNISFRHTLIGTIGIAEENGFITNLFFEGELSVPEPPAEAPPLTCEAFRQLDAYLDGELQTLSLPLAPHPTVFAGHVRQGLLEIPYGSTASYAAVAEAIGASSAARAVGTACSRNPLPIFIPCHRVVQSSGRFGGYRGGGALKAALIQLESESGGGNSFQW
ncbi:methylated-DNA--[protein]-cysteine S-methyltransferase [Chlorobium phaeovibrioides]|uniref:methylated-DNA--[protein]-cysteine S-methyltransferase n=1 Tax=Chlorobium phaeovibrioides TaxID=1094 RepID=UPI001230C8EF|nr:methylated-DNA--[protein]-cysteine S-methyltransferase [Chlorobium phaeovibrioides]QEQ56875.1 methylated-DNA--[protein]-cysteine S-methyltransferase [Chlorobium phaeovibrioides]